MVKVVKALTTLALALAILIAGSTRDVHADMDEAKKLFRKGEKAFSAGKYRKALERYQEAYAEESLAGFHFNIAQCHRNLGEYKKAAAAFAAYLDESDDPPNKTQVEGTLEQLRILAKARRDVPAPRTTRAPESTTSEPCESNRLHRCIGTLPARSRGLASTMTL